MAATRVLAFAPFDHDQTPKLAWPILRICVQHMPGCFPLEFLANSRRLSHNPHFTLLVLSASPVAVDVSTRAAALTDLT